MWLVWWDHLPHKVLLSLRKIIATHICSWCQNLEEDSLHAIRDCNHAVWAAIQPPHQFWTQTNVKEWLAENLTNLQVVRGIEWRVVFPFICYKIWKSRNKNIFEQKPFAAPEQTINVAFLLTAQFLNIPHSPSLSYPKCEYNWAYDDTFVHVNVDATFINIETVSSIAGLLRSDKGVWIMGFHCPIYATKALHAELLVIRYGLQVASDVMQIWHI